MQKSKLGISVGLLGACMFLACFFGGYTVAIILAGYILLFEENAWLKRSTVKGVTLMFAFALLSAMISFVPDIISFIDSICKVFDGYFYITFVSNIINVVDTILEIAEKLLFIVLGVKALNQGTVVIPVIDMLLNKHMN